VEGKFLKITDRKKEIFKTSGGKYIVPQAMENKFKESRFIEQIMVIGEGEKFPAAFVVPNFAFAKEWAHRHGLQFESMSNEEIIKRRQVYSRHFTKTVRRLQNLSRNHFGNHKKNWIANPKSKPARRHYRKHSEVPH
jgi:long-subunit acyl-CoA synthetase (AMP-forming)